MYAIGSFFKLPLKNGEVLSKICNEILSVLYCVQLLRNAHKVKSRFEERISLERTDFKINL